MKKLLLLLTAGSIGLSLNAQESKHSVVFGSGQQNYKKVSVADEKTRTYAPKAHTTGHTANKTTVASARWYDYSAYMSAYVASLSGTSTVSFPIIWNDTLGKVNYTSGLAYNTMTSAGSVLHPQFTGFNDATFFPGEMVLSATDAYTIDSVELLGLYVFNTAKSAVVDTLTLSFTNGIVLTPGDDIVHGIFTDATLVGNYGGPSGDSIEFGMVKYDSVKNTAAGTTVYTFKIPLGSSAWGDTIIGGGLEGLYNKKFKLPVAYSVPAGNVVGYTLSFKSGDAAFIPGDTISGSRYNIFRPAYVFKGTSAVPEFAPTDFSHPHADWNSGQFKSLPNYENGWENVYIPMYAWTSGGGASTLGQNTTGFHITCTTCGVVNAVENVVNSTSSIAYPNPAANELNVNFTVATAANVTVSLVNTLGQVVASQSVNNTTNGTVTFNTAKIAAGVYSYTVTANGERTTGRVVVAH